MAIKVFLEEAVKKIEVERDRAVAVVKEKVTREQIIPYNQDIDKAREEAINELTVKHNEQVKALQDKFVAEKQALVEAGEKKKNEHATALLETETAMVKVKYNNSVAELNKQIEKLDE